MWKNFTKKMKHLLTTTRWLPAWRNPLRQNTRDNHVHHCTRSPRRSYQLIDQRKWNEILAVHPGTSRAAGRWAFVESLSDRDVGTDAGTPAQHRSGYVHPEPVGNKLCAIPWRVLGRLRRRKGAMMRRRNKMRPVNRLAATPLRNRIPQQTRFKVSSGLQKKTTQIHHTHPV